jgi:hypothetical protein
VWLVEINDHYVCTFDLVVESKELIQKRELHVIIYPNFDPIFSSKKHLTTPINILTVLPHYMPLDLEETEIFFLN